MARAEKKRPTDGELEILGVLWTCGPSTVREVFESLSHQREIGHTTVLKLMQIMTEKGLLTRDETQRPQVFSAARSRHQTQRQLLGDLADRIFAGSPGNLVLQALSSRRIPAEEREQIRTMLDRMEGGDR